MSSDVTELERQVETFMQEQRWDECLKALGALVDIDPDSLNYTARFAYLLDGLGNTQHAINAYARLLGRQPGIGAAHFNVALLFKKMQQYEQANAAYDEAIRLEIDHVEEVFLNKGVLYAETHQPEKAKATYQDALNLVEDYVPAMFNLAGILEEEGDREQALELYQRILKIQPDYWDALARLVNAEKMTEEHANLVARVEEAIAATGNDAAAQETLNFALGKARDDMRDYDSAATAYTAANAIAKSHSTPYVRAQTEQGFDELIELYDPELIAKNASGSDAEPVFVCGMFRSGSTLLENRLAAHSSITAGGELDLLPWMIGRNLAPFPQGIKVASPERLREMADYYQAKVQGFFPGAARVVDKRPDNFMHLGLIKMLFPKAKFIHTTRQIADNCLSVYFQHLGPGLGYATDLGDAAHYYQQQERLKAHWEKCLGDDLLTVGYEDLLAEPETALRTVVAFLGLEWEDELLEPSHSDGRVRTASIWQVRQALHTRSKGRWRNYEALVKAVPELAGSTG